MREATRTRARRALALALAAIGLPACLSEPELEDRWTRVDLLGARPGAGTRYAPGDSVTVEVRASVTYRRILTGFLVTELRASGAIDAGSVEIAPGAERLGMAEDVDSVLLGSIGAGRAVRAVTGWDHLIQEISFSFGGCVPLSTDSSGAGPVGLFVVSYLASGEEIELEDGRDSLVVTPFRSRPNEILPVGFELAVGEGGS